MERVKRDFGSLPYEVLINMFQKTGRYLLDIKSCAQYALVCKAWLSPAQSILYSDVRISSLSRLEKFYNTVERRSCLGKKVKKFYSGVSLPPHYDADARKGPFDQTFNLLSNLLFSCLPNLEEIAEKSLETYVPILNALKDSRLKQLKNLATPSLSYKQDELDNYAVCALLMCNRIEKIAIVVHSEPNSLYDKLYQFSKLTKLKIYDQNAEGIHVLEQVLSACKFLKKLNFDFKTFENTTDFIDRISTFAPANNIESLKATMGVNVCKIIWYIMHKFPQLHTLQFEIDYDSRATLDQTILTQFLNYTHQIESLDAPLLRVNDYNNLLESVADYWERTSKPGKESVFVSYGGAEDDPLYFGLYKPNGVNEDAFINLYYSERNFEQQYIDFIKKNGKYISELRFDFPNDCQVESTGFPTTCIAQTFKYCSNLQSLQLTRGEWKSLDYSKFELWDRLSLDELHLLNCTFCPGSLERLSLLLPEVQRLRIDVGCIPYFRNTSTQIILPNTKVGSIIFEYGKKFFLQIYAMNDVTYYYYLFTDKVFKASNEQEYNEADESSKVFVCCQTKPTLESKSYSFIEI